MIIDSFDNKTPAKINPKYNPNAPVVDICILTFSHIIEKYILENYKCEQIAELRFATGATPIYAFDYNGKRIAWYKTFIGSAGCVGTIEDTLSLINTKKYILFGGGGCLNKEIAHGKIVVPTDAYRDEGTSYHYVPASDYIKIKNADVVTEFMKQTGIPYVRGKTWTTDGVYRETEANIAKHKADGCIEVEMEGAGVQAVCDFRGLDVYMFFTSGDLVDAPKHLHRTVPGSYAGTQHDANHFEIALRLADYVTK